MLRKSLFWKLFHYKLLDKTKARASISTILYQSSNIFSLVPVSSAIANKIFSVESETDYTTNADVSLWLSHLSLLRSSMTLLWTLGVLRPYKFVSFTLIRVRQTFFFVLFYNYLKVAWSNFRVNIFEMVSQSPQ